MSARVLAHEARLSAPRAFLHVRSCASKPRHSRSLAQSTALALARHTGIPITLRRDYGLAKDVSRHLTSNYGTRALQVAELVRRRPDLGRRLSPLYPFLAAEVVFACEQEYAETAVDVLARRTRLAFLDADVARAAVSDVVALMAASKGWARARREAEEKAAVAFIETMHAPVKAL